MTFLSRLFTAPFSPFVKGVRSIFSSIPLERKRINIGPAEGFVDIPLKATGNDSSQIKSEAPLTDSQTQAGVGILLGDGAMIHGNKGSAILFGQSVIHTFYLLFVFDLFFDYCHNFPNLVCMWDPRYNHYNYLWRFNTMTLPCFDQLYFLFYDEQGNRRLHPSIGDFLTEISLAHWIMCDGRKDPAWGSIFRHILLYCRGSRFISVGYSGQL